MARQADQTARSRLVDTSCVILAAMFTSLRQTALHAPHEVQGVIPLLASRHASVERASDSVEVRFVGLDNYSRLLATPLFWKALARTMATNPAAAEVVLGQAVFNWNYAKQARTYVKALHMEIAKVHQMGEDVYNAQRLAPKRLGLCKHLPASLILSAGYIPDERLQSRCHDFRHNGRPLQCQDLPGERAYEGLRRRGSGSPRAGRG